jgi:glycosyltransferase involved in cell wall biosynthesis
LRGTEVNEVTLSATPTDDAVMETGSEIRQIAFFGNYLPRRCGIATFTTDLCRSVAARFPATQCLAVPATDIEEGYDYPKEVSFEIKEQELASYQHAADFLNIRNVDVVSLQHEFGIFGGSAGGHILVTLRAAKMPIVTTFHTILQNPDPDQRRVMRELVARSTRFVVMTQRGQDLLRTIYGVPEEKISIIPHGIPDMPFVDPSFYKDEFGVEGKLVLLTFGLLSPNKGIEHVLNALPEILTEFPQVVYIILGATHPKLVREQGEAYRFSLERITKKNGIQKNVIFYDRFVDIGELRKFIGASDVYVTPYLNEAQITSGTLAYVFGSGKAVVSTPYWHAQELLADERGVLVPFADSKALAREIIQLLRDELRRNAMRKNAYKLGREMIWSNVARLYMRTFEQARREQASSSRRTFNIATLDQQPRRLPELKLDHLVRMTDSTGIFQHATFTVPNFTEGYCTDDNSRALIFSVMLEELGYESERVRSLATNYAAFLHYAFNRKNGRFRNFMGFDRRWLEELGSEDSHGRALWALGYCIGRTRRRSFQELAARLFGDALGATADFVAPRAWAYTLIGIDEYLRRLSGDRLVTGVRQRLTDQLMEAFAKCACPDWFWCEEAVTYDNAKLPHALIQTGDATGQKDVVEMGLRALRWLAELQTADGGWFRPIGNNGFYPRGGRRAVFDQQPIEAHAMVSACLEAHRCTDEPYWYDMACRAFDWFLGWNDLGVEVHSSNSGGCYDALHMDRVNRNQGAESLLAFLLSRAEMELMEQSLATSVQTMSAP